MPLLESALLRLPVSAFLALLLQTWPVQCLLLPMVKGTAAGHQQALAAQAEQWRIRGR